MCVYHVLKVLVQEVTDGGGASSCSWKKEICLRIFVGTYRALVRGGGRIGCSLAISGEGKRGAINRRRSGVIHMMPLPCDAMGKTGSEVDGQELGSVPRAVCLGGTKI